METNCVLATKWTTLMNQLLWCNLVVLGFYNEKAYFSLSVLKRIKYYKQNDHRGERKKLVFLSLRHTETCRILGRAVAQAVTRWLPTAAARIRVRAARGVCGGQKALGQVFSEYVGFPCQSFHQFLHHHNHPGLAQ
jgi:hypothetical protein